MKYEEPLPDAAREMLARFGATIEYTDREPDGVVNLAETEVTNDDLRYLVFYPGFGALNLDKTLVSDEGTNFIGEMSSLACVSLYDTLVSDDGLKNLLGLRNLEHLDIGCAPG